MVKWRRLGLSAVFVWAAALTQPSLAYAQEEAGELLDQATEQLESLRYDEARDGFFAVVTSGTAEPEQLAKAYFNTGIVEAALNNGTSSIDAFYLALMIQPSLALGLGGSPKIEVFLNQARDRIVGVGSLTAKASFRKGALEVNVGNDPLTLVQSVVVTMSTSDGESGTVTLEPGSSSVEVADDVESIEVVLLDETGNQLKVMSVEPKETAKPSVADEVSTPWTSWGLWAGVAAASAGGGAFFLMKSSERGDEVSALERSDAPDATTIARLEDEQSKLSTYGLVGFGLAGAAAVAVGTLLLMGDEPVEEEVALAPQLGPDLWGATLQLRF